MTSAAAAAPRPAIPIRGVARPAIPPNILLPAAPPNTLPPTAPNVLAPKYAKINFPILSDIKSTSFPKKPDSLVSLFVVCFLLSELPILLIASNSLSSRIACSFATSSAN